MIYIMDMNHNNIIPFGPGYIISRTGNNLFVQNTSNSKDWFIIGAYSSIEEAQSAFMRVAQKIKNGDKVIEL